MGSGARGKLSLRFARSDAAARGGEFSHICAIRPEVYEDRDFVAKWGSAGAGDGQFNNAVPVAVDGSGNVFVADSANFRIQKFACP